mgnify:CR=1 FL=1|tara:strand:- start:3623 stop:3787 length:165 start_codon:yes stop_codon:yes gene_type:complete
MPEHIHNKLIQLLAVMSSSAEDIYFAVDEHYELDEFKELLELAKEENKNIQRRS